MPELKTSKVRIRPFKPCLKDEEKEGREPFAVLSYGGVEIEIDYTIFRSLRFDNKADYFCKTVSVGTYALKEIINEMEYNLYGDEFGLPGLHRDGNHLFVKNKLMNPIHPENPEVVEYEALVKI